MAAHKLSNAAAVDVPPPPADLMRKDGWCTNPVTLGLLLGLLLIGPDHLGTLMALSTLTSGVESFKVGFAWGLGHSVGMILICPIFILLRSWSSKEFSISMERWEYCGDYFIGISMVLVAGYFIYFESSYLERQKDGTYVAKPCSCHSTLHEHEAEAAEAEQDVVSPKFCRSYQAGRLSAACAGANIRGKRQSTGEDEDTPLLPASDAAVAQGGVWSWSLRDIQGALLGALQGLCCPMGLAGLGFLGRMSMTSSFSMLFVFATVFVLASALGSGLISLCWGKISSSGSDSCISPKLMYRASCLGTLCLGVLWIIANVYGVLDSINFVEAAVEQKMHAAVRAA